MDENIHGEDKLRSKDTRWDRIRKRHMPSLTVKTDTVKRFLEVDFIGKQHIKLLSEDSSKKKVLNPVLVMDLRHEMIRRSTKRKPPITSKDIPLENTKSHNKTVEEHYIESQLTKFKSDLSKPRRKTNIRCKLSVNLNNGAIFESLDKCNKHTIDFYETVQNALEATNKIVHPEEPDLAEIKTSVEDSPAEIKTIMDGGGNRTDMVLHEKTVRFEESVEIINYSPRDDMLSEIGSSNTSSDVESVASDIVEDVFQEVQIEAEIEMIGKSFDALQKPQLNAILPEIHPEEPYRQPDEPENEFPAIEPLQITKILPSETIASSESNRDQSNDSASSKTSGTVSKEQDAIICELFSRESQNSKKLLRKYLLRWTHATTISKIEKMNMTTKNDRYQKINSFLDKIRREKQIGPNQRCHDLTKGAQDTKENSVVLSKKYQNKIKIQQDIIDLQKLKLERQERLILELKLNKLLDEHKQSKEDVKQELKAIVKTGDVKNRTKAKCLQLVGNLREEEDEDEFSRLKGKALMMPQFLINMQERAVERNMKHEQAKQRRLQQEAEREAVKIAAEEAKRLEDEEAKQKRIEALKEKRRLEKLAKMEKERARQRCIENNKKCQEFRRRWLLQSIGMEGFRRLLKRKRRFQKLAETHRRIVLKRKVFQSWTIYVHSVWEHKNQMADNHYLKIVKRFAFRAWVTYYNGERSKFLVAVDWYELKITEAIFQQWIGLMKLHKLVEDTKTAQALSHYNWNLRWKVLDHWRRLPQMLKIQKETEERRQRWRMKIWELLPDYKPNVEE